MYTSIQPKNPGCFSSEFCIQDLRRVNFILGPNGSGKSTISKQLASGNLAEALTADSRLPRVRLFNKEFVTGAFAEAGAEGVFRVGEGVADIEQELSVAQDAWTEAEERRFNLDAELHGDEGLVNKRKSARRAFEEHIWASRGRTIPPDLRSHIPFANVNKARFADSAIGASKESADALDDWHILRDEASRLEQSVEPSERIRALGDDGSSIIDLPAVLTVSSTVNSGSEYAPLIRALSSQEWIREGLPLLERTEDTCPFCQQDTPVDLANELQKIFDESYKRALNQVRAVRRGILSLQSEFDTLRPSLESALTAWSVDIGSDLRALRAYAEALQAALVALDAKERDLTANPACPDVAVARSHVSDAVAAANHRIDAHNSRLANLSKARKEIGQRALRLFSVGEMERIANFVAADAKIDGRIGEKRRDLKAQEAVVAERKAEALRLRELSGSRLIAVESINDLLCTVGFDGFRVAPADESGSRYVLRRGEEQADISTLSEGEANFLTFVYFLEGVREEMMSDESPLIVALDDPMSSLDSGVFYFVASLTRLLVDEVESGQSSIGQLFIFTHNLAFFGEVSERGRGVKADARAHYIMKKGGTPARTSISERRPDAPVVSEYDMLWMDYFRAARGEGEYGIGLANSMRRICEFFFKGMCGLSFPAIEKNLEGGDRLAAKALFSWENRESHKTADYVYVVSDSDAIERLVNVFPRLFDKSGMEQHYAHMMERAERLSGKS